MNSPHALKQLATILALPDSEIEELHSNTAAHYRRRTLVTGHKRRELAVPSERLRRVHAALRRRLFSQLPHHAASYCRSGRGIVTNAALHLGAGFGWTFDIRDAFPSASHQRVLRALRRTLARNALPSGIAAPITQLCTFGGSLPQGASTSPFLLEVVLWPLDEQLADIAASEGLRYSRYVDDMAFSGSRRVRTLAQRVRGSLNDVGFTLNEGKTREWSPSRRPTITGLVLRDRLEIPPEYVSRVRASISYSLRAEALSTRDYNRLRGMLNYIASVQPRTSAALLTRLESAINSAQVVLSG